MTDSARNLKEQQLTGGMPVCRQAGQTHCPGKHRPLWSKHTPPLPTGSGAQGLRRQVSALAGAPACRHALAKSVPVRTIEACLPQMQRSVRAVQAAPATPPNRAPLWDARLQAKLIPLECFSPHQQHAYDRALQCCWAAKHTGTCTGRDTGPFWESRLDQAKCRALAVIVVTSGP